jgi:hypothetical protein
VRARSTDGFDRAHHAPLVLSPSSGSDVRAQLPHWAARGGALVDAFARRSCARLGVRSIALAQLHWWDWAHDGWRDAARRLSAHPLVAAVGVTNMDAAHLEALLDDGVVIVSNQVRCAAAARAEVWGRARRSRVLYVMVKDADLSLASSDNVQRRVNDPLPRHGKRATTGQTRTTVKTSSDRLFQHTTRDRETDGASRKVHFR